jgi:hypothetical protein
LPVVLLPQLEVPERLKRVEAHALILHSIIFRRFPWRRASCMRSTLEPAR